MQRSSVIAILSSALLFLAACTEEPLAPGPDTGPVTAYFDGETFVAASAAMIRHGYDVRIEATAADGRSITFEFPDEGDRNYLIGPGNPVSATVTIGASTWLGDEDRGGGTITVPHADRRLLQLLPGGWPGWASRGHPGAFPGRTIGGLPCEYRA